MTGSRQNASWVHWQVQCDASVLINTHPRSSWDWLGAICSSPQPTQGYTQCTANDNETHRISTATVTRPVADRGWRRGTPAHPTWPSVFGVVWPMILKKYSRQKQRSSLLEKTAECGGLTLWYSTCFSMFFLRVTVVDLGGPPHAAVGSACTLFDEAAGWKLLKWCSCLWWTPKAR